MNERDEFIRAIVYRMLSSLDSGGPRFAALYKKLDVVTLGDVIRTTVEAMLDGTHPGVSRAMTMRNG